MYVYIYIYIILNCLTKSIVYKAKVKSTDDNARQTYIGVTANNFKTMSVVLSSMYIYSKDQMRPNTTVNVRDRLGTFAGWKVLMLLTSKGT